MNAQKTGSVVLILGGVALVYLAVTGYAGNVWEALKGGGLSAPGTSSGATTAPATQKAGGVSRALGRGRGGQVSNVPYRDKGVYYPSPAGGMLVSDQGIW